MKLLTVKRFNVARCQPYATTSIFRCKLLFDSTYTFYKNRNILVWDFIFPFRLVFFIRTTSNNPPLQLLCCVDDIQKLKVQLNKKTDRTRKLFSGQVLVGVKKSELYHFLVCRIFVDSKSKVYCLELNLNIYLSECRLIRLMPIMAF